MVSRMMAKPYEYGMFTPAIMESSTCTTITQAASDVLLICKF